MALVSNFNNQLATLNRNIDELKKENTRSLEKLQEDTARLQAEHALLKRRIAELLQELKETPTVPMGTENTELASKIATKPASEPDSKTALKVAPAKLDEAKQERSLRRQQSPPPQKGKYLRKD